jgi:hypothetical protein
MNGMTIIARIKTAIYLRIPRDMQQSAGGCNCPHCKQDPSLAMWDTLAVPMDGGYAYTVHMPDASVEGFMDYCRRTGQV